MKSIWFWPGWSELNDFPEPLGFEDEWRPWEATLEDGPPVKAEIFSREYIQNSWDSIQRKTKNGGTGSLQFRFVELEGGEAKAFVENFALNEHGVRMDGMKEKERASNRLGEAGKTVAEKNPTKLRLLVAAERLAEGMPGWEPSDDVDKDLPVMRIALIQSITGKGEQGGTGGSWGQGKKAVAAGSALRTLAVYTCHPQTKEEPGVTRRFLGVTYWMPHSFDGKRARGLGLLGRERKKGEDFREFRPFENEAADKLVRELNVPGLETRNPEEEADHGTTFLFVEPAFEPADLARAIARNWWPLLIDQKLQLEVIDYEGDSLELITRGDPSISPFTKAYDIACGRDKPDAATELREKVEVKDKVAGTLAVISDISEAGWSFDQPENGNTDLVALIRNDMVIAYQRFPPSRGRRQPPYVRGSFVVTADGGDGEGEGESAGEILKMTEGHLHNEWKTRTEEVGDATRAAFARSVLRSINEGTKNLRKRISKSEEIRDVPIRAFEEIFSTKGPSKGSHKNPPPPPPPRDFTIQEASKTELEFDSDKPTLLRLRAGVNVALSDNCKQDEMEVTIKLGWKVREEGLKRDSSLADPSNDVVPSGFKRDGDVWVGVLTREQARFDWVSQFFPNDWQVTPDPEVRPAAGDDDNGSSK